MRPKLRIVLCVSALWLSGPAAHRTHGAQGYDHFIVGDAGNVSRSTEGLTVLHGGGTERNRRVWPDDAVAP